MSRHNYTTSIIDEHLNDAVIIADLDCEVDVGVEIIGGDLNTSVDAVLIDGYNLMKGDEFSRALATRIMANAEREIERGGWLWDQVKAENNIAYSGLGGNDPDGSWKRVA